MFSVSLREIKHKFTWLNFESLKHNCLPSFVSVPPPREPPFFGPPAERLSAHFISADLRETRAGDFV